MEATGQLHELQEDDGYLIARIGPAKVALPSEVGEKLKGCIGKRISILRTDTDFRLLVEGMERHC
jgi:hypothetical protein